MPSMFKQKKGLQLLPGNANTTGVRTGIGAGLKTVKMVKPRCPQYELNDEGILVPASDNCQAIYRHPLWWKLCTHKGDSGNDIFWRVSEIIKTKPVVEVQEDGRRLITGQEQIIEEIRELNVTQVPMYERITSGKAIGNARYRGFKTLEELGFRRACEYGNCFAQPDELLNTPYGFFCTEYQARLVGADIEEIILEVNDLKKRDAQLRALNLEAY